MDTCTILANCPSQFPKQQALFQRTNSSVSFTAKAADSAGEISTSSISPDNVAKVRFQSSAKGPAVVSFGKTPTLFFICATTLVSGDYTTAVSLDRALTPALLITSMHFSKDLSFPSGSFVVTNISTGILPPLSGSRCLAEWTPSIQQISLVLRTKGLPFLAVVTT